MLIHWEKNCRLNNVVDKSARMGSDLWICTISPFAGKKTPILLKSRFMASLRIFLWALFGWKKGGHTSCEPRHARAWHLQVRFVESIALFPWSRHEQKKRDSQFCTVLALVCVYLCQSGERWVLASLLSVPLFFQTRLCFQQSQPHNNPARCTCSFRSHTIS